MGMTMARAERKSGEASSVFISYSMPDRHLAIEIEDVALAIGAQIVGLPVGVDILTQVRDAIAAADLFVCVLSHDGFRSNVAFETGVALGLGTPVLAVTSTEGADFRLPMDVMSVNIIPGNKEAIRLAL